jgi:hypothetical protein
MCEAPRREWPQKITKSTKENTPEELKSIFTVLVFLCAFCDFLWPFCLCGCSQ